MLCGQALEINSKDNVMNIQEETKRSPEYFEKLYKFYREVFRQNM